MEQVKAAALSRMMRLCSVSEHCRSDIFRKLETGGVSNPEEIVEQLCKEGYIDERRYAAAFARDKSSLQGWGSAKIKLALQRKGIDKPTIAGALLEIDTEAADKKLRSVLEARWKALRGESDPQKKMAKLFRFALGRGYGYDQIKKIYDTFRTT
ncbi:MAG: RecX family transcriptional regulator [Bacteroidales bacterium]|nr:RecX family transcriptional regulator [Candidatus Cacconaster merdequi]